MLSGRDPAQLSFQLVNLPFLRNLRVLRETQAPSQEGSLGHVCGSDFSVMEDTEAKALCKGCVSGVSGMEAKGGHFVKGMLKVPLKTLRCWRRCRQGVETAQENQVCRSKRGLKGGAV